MLVSAVLDPSAFDKDCFDDLYAIHAEDFLEGIWRNGVLIIDKGGKLQGALYRNAKCLPSKEHQSQILLTEILKTKSVAVHLVSLSNLSSMNLLDLMYHLKTQTKADILILGDKDFEDLRFTSKYGDHISSLSKYRDSDLEKDRQRYYDGLGPIDAYSKLDVDKIIIRSIRFSKRLRFYDKYIVMADNTSNFLNGIKYILSLWRDHGFFVSHQDMGAGEVEIFTGTEHIREDEVGHPKESKLARRQENYQKVKQGLMAWLKKEAPQWWRLKVFVKDDPDGIFHARYLETQHAIIRIDRGFDLFNQDNEFRRNFFTLNTAESSHLKECRELPNATL